jgi:hypothetical protein
VIFLFDDLNLSSGDLMLAQKAATKLLETSLAASDTAAVLSTSGANSGLTRDRAKLQQAILNIKPNNIYRYDAQGCPKVDYYTADLIVEKHDAMALEAAVEDTVTCAALPNDPKGIQAATLMVHRLPTALWPWGNKLIGPILASSGWWSASWAPCRGNTFSSSFPPDFSLLLRRPWPSLLKFSRWLLSTT